jgi:limonene 1,2-monooxygenase
VRFGIFLPPMHKTGVNPHLALHRDLELMELLDDLGYDEAWIGEHHSSGVELIASPEVFIAAAGERTRHIKLGTGVSSLPYHHPFILADRIVLLDHLTRGRAMFGVGPGQLGSDAVMLGIDPNVQRPRMEESFEVIMRLLRGETVTEKTDWFTCEDAVLQVSPYSDFDIAVAASISPSGSRLAGRHGVGLLSVAATDPRGVEVLANHWEIMEEEAAVAGVSVSRDKWRLMGPMHLAPTVEEAKEECRPGLQWIFDYLSHVTPTRAALPLDFDEAVEVMNKSGRGVIGTPEMAVAQIERLQAASGGFGCYLHMGADFADWRAQRRHFELFAEAVIPRFNGQLEPVQGSYDRIVASGRRFADATAEAQAGAASRYQTERAAR